MQEIEKVPENIDQLEIEVAEILMSLRVYRWNMIRMFFNYFCYK